jgi:hypothetical protein
VTPHLVDVIVPASIDLTSSKQSHHNGLKSANTYGSGRQEKRSPGDTPYTDN